MSIIANEQRGQIAASPLRKFRVSGLWEMFRIDHADIEARSASEARAKFRARYKSRRSVTNVQAYPA